MQRSPRDMDPCTQRTPTRTLTKPLIAALLGIVLLLFLAIFGQVIETHDPTKNRLVDSMIPPAWTAEGSSDHILGTDRFGRDHFSISFTACLGE